MTIKYVTVVFLLVLNALMPLHAHNVYTEAS